MTHSAMPNVQIKYSQNITKAHALDKQNLHYTRLVVEPTHKKNMHKSNWIIIPLESGWNENMVYLPPPSCK